MNRPLISFAVLSMFTWLLSGCTQLFFHPHSYLIDTPARYGLEYQSEDFSADDGTKLNAWFIPAVPGASDKSGRTILFLHGNAENISTHFRSVAWLAKQGFNVFALDYRGYGASEGSPSLKGIQLDIDAAMRHLLTHNNVDPRQIIILGQSLGGAFTIHYVAHSRYRANIRAVVIDSSFDDYRKISREKLSGFFLTWPFQWLPWLVIDNDYSPEKSIAAISPIPLLLIHGDSDMVVPVKHAKRLFSIAKEPKELWIIPGVGHTLSFTVDSVRDRLLNFLNRLPSIDL